MAMAKHRENQIGVRESKAATIPTYAEGDKRSERNSCVRMIKDNIITNIYITKHLNVFLLLKKYIIIIKVAIFYNANF